MDGTKAGEKHITVSRSVNTNCFGVCGSSPWGAAFGGRKEGLCFLAGSDPRSRAPASVSARSRRGTGLSTGQQRAYAPNNRGLTNANTVRRKIRLLVIASEWIATTVTKETSISSNAYSARSWASSSCQSRFNSRYMEISFQSGAKQVFLSRHAAGWQSAFQIPWPYATMKRKTHPFDNLGVRNLSGCCRTGGVPGRTSDPLFGLGKHSLM